MDSLDPEKQDAPLMRNPEYVKKIAQFRLMDDEFFSETLDGKIEAVQFILDIILERTDFTVLETKTQHTYPSAAGHAVILDIRAKDSRGRVADIEIQRSDRGAGAKRARYHSSMLDRELLDKGSEYDSLPETFVIFITEKDRFGAGLPLYHIDRAVRELPQADFGDESHIIYVNGAFQNTDHPVGRLMHDFWCTDSEDMYSPVLAEQVRHMKHTEEGYRQMSRIMEDLFKQGIAQGIAEGKAEEKRQSIETMISLGYPDDMISRCLTVSIEEVAAVRSGLSA